MAKVKTHFVCSECGYSVPKWMGICSQCSGINSFHEENIVSETVVGVDLFHQVSKPELLHTITVESVMRIETSMNEFNRVLGGGIVPASITLMSGEPGIGKSTLLLQIAAMCAQNYTVLYLSSEESKNQIKLRAKRLGITDSSLFVSSEYVLEHAVQIMRDIKPHIIIVDSIQTLHTHEINYSRGSVNAIRSIVESLVQIGRQLDSAMFFVAHVTKDGMIAGPKTIEHLVDVVLFFDDAKSNNSLRFLRSMKNRFGSTEELGIFSMNEDGLRELDNAQDSFILQRDVQPAGITLTPLYEGSRILLVEIQALNITSKNSMQRIYSDKVDNRKISRIAAILEKHLRVHFSDQDLYINIAGGLRVDDVSSDLAIALALYSSRCGIAIPANVAIIGELSLAGEVLVASHMKRRIQACIDMGLSHIIAAPIDDTVYGYTGVKTIHEAIKSLFSDKNIFSN